MSLHEIVLPETKPETEWVGGRALRKVSPTYSHARLQFLIANALTEWSDAGDRGRVGPEWRFRVTPPGEMTRPLVPDVAYLAYETLARNAAFGSVEVPLAAPTVAVEILSPDDRLPDVREKVRTYLSAGSVAVFVVDPATRRCDVHDARGHRRLREGDVLSHVALPNFALDLSALFDRAAR